MVGDARSALGGWTLRAICLLGAAAMAAAGAYLFEPALADLGVYVERGKYALARYVLIYAALLIAFASTAGVLRTRSLLVNYALSFVVGPIALMALGLLFAALAVDAAFYRDPANLWVALLAVPAALCFLASSLSEFAEKQAEEQEGATGGSRGALAGLLIVAFSFALLIAAVILAINAGYLLFYLLQVNLLDDRDIDLTRVGPALIAVLREVAGERWLLVVIVSALGTALIYAFVGLANLGSRASQRGQRALRPKDEAFVVHCAQELEAYAMARGYDRDARRLLWFVALPLMFAPMLVALVVGPNLHDWFPRPYDPAVLAPLGWHVYERSLGPAAIVTVFASLLWGALPGAVISRLWPRYSEAGGWSGFATQQLSVKHYLALFLRSGFLSRDRMFDPGEFLRRINTMHEPYFLFPAVVLSLAAAIAWHHDISRYHLLTDRYVEVMRYWTLEKQRYAYPAIREVALACTYDNGRSVVAYGIALPGGFSIDLFDKRIPERLADLARVDGLIPASVPRRFANLTPLFGEVRSAYDTLCVEEVAAGMTAEDGERFRQIFRVEQWHRARWRERIRAAK